MTPAPLRAATLAARLGPWTARGPAYRDLAAAIRTAVLDGRIPLGTRLPGERELAAALHVSRTTTTAAYAALRDDGFIHTRPGARPTTTLPARAPIPGSPIAPGDDTPDLIDLAYATLPAPEGVLHHAYAAALAALPAHLPEHGYAPLGLNALRAAVAERYAHRGLPTRPEQIIITSGAQHAFALITRALTAPGDPVIIEHPTYLHALDTLQHHACRLVPVPMTGDGWDLDALRAALTGTRPKLAYLIPDYQNPTGCSMPAEDRAVTAHLAHRHDVPTVIDETVAELNLDAPTPAPLAAHDPRGPIITIGSTSKTFWGGLRVGWIRAPREITARIAAHRTTTDLGTPILEQLAVTALLADADRILDARRAELRRRRATLEHLLAHHLPDWQYRRPEGGLSLWARMPSSTGAALAATADRYGVRIIPGARFGVGGAFERHVRVPFTLPPDRLEEALRRLSRAYAAVLAHAPRDTRAPGAPYGA